MASPIAQHVACNTSPVDTRQVLHARGWQPRSGPLVSFHQDRVRHTCNAGALTFLGYPLHLTLFVQSGLAPFPSSSSYQGPRMFKFSAEW